MSDHNEIEQLSAYVDGRLDTSERAALERHVAGCAECTRVLEALRATLADLASLPSPALDAGSIARLDEAVAAERAARRLFTRRWGWASGAAAAGVVVALVAVLAVVRQSPNETGVRSLGGPAAAVGGSVQDNSATNYTEESLALALATFSESTLESAPIGAPAQDGAFTSGNQSGAGTRSNIAPYSAKLSGESASRVSRCAEKIESPDRNVRTIRFETARFKGQEAFVLFYQRPRTDSVYAEVWVVRPSDCETLYFAQRRL